MLEKIIPRLPLKQTTQLLGATERLLKVTEKCVDHAQGQLKQVQHYIDRLQDELQPARSADMFETSIHEKQAEWWTHFEQIRFEKLPEFVAYYMLNLAKEDHWSLEQESLLCAQYGQVLTLPYLESAQLLKGNRSIDVLPHLLTWLESKEIETYPQLGLLDNITPLFIRDGQVIAKEKFQEFKNSLTFHHTH